MQSIDLEAIVPGLREARARERLHRAAAFAGLPWTVCGQPCVHLTPDHRLELQIVGNAFACGGTATMADVVQFLWRLNPEFQVKPSLRSWMARRRLDRALRGASLAYCVREVGEYLTGMLQDMPESDGDATAAESPAADAADYVHWMASDACFFARQLGMPIAEYRRTPYLILQQLHRAHRVATDADAQFIDASDRLAQDWLKRNAPKNRREN